MSRRAVTAVAPVGRSKLVIPHPNFSNPSSTQTVVRLPNTVRARLGAIRFGIGAMLIVVTGLCVWLGSKASRARCQSDAVAVIQKLGGTVRYDWQPTANEEEERAEEVWKARNAGVPPPRFIDEPSGPEWLRSLVGDAYFQSVVEVRVRKLPGESDSAITTAELARIGKLPHLSHLSLINCKIDDAAVRHLRRLKRLQVLNLANNPISGEGLSHLARLRKLRSLCLNETQLTDDGLKYLPVGNALTRLYLSLTSIGDASLSVLRTFTHLEHLEIRRTNISVAGYVSLERELNELEVRYEPTIEARQALPRRLQQIVVTKAAGESAPGNAQMESFAP